MPRTLSFAPASSSLKRVLPEEFGIQRKALADHQLVQADGFAIDGANADMPFVVGFVRPEVIAANTVACRSGSPTGHALPRRMSMARRGRRCRPDRTPGRRCHRACTSYRQAGWCLHPSRWHPRPNLNLPRTTTGTLSNIALINPGAGRMKILSRSYRTIEIRERVGKCRFLNSAGTWAWRHHAVPRVGPASCGSRQSSRHPALKRPINSGLISIP